MKTKTRPTTTVTAAALAGRRKRKNGIGTNTRERQKSLEDREERIARGCAMLGIPVAQARRVAFASILAECAVFDGIPGDLLRAYLATAPENVKIGEALTELHAQMGTDVSEAATFARVAGRVRAPGRGQPRRSDARDDKTATGKTGKSEVAE